MKDAARAAESNPAVRALARGGDAATGLVHLLLGGLVVAVALGGASGQTSQSGAMEALAGAPFGVVLVWIVAALLAALGAYQLVNGVVVRESDAAARWRARLSAWGRAIVYLALAGLAASIAVGARPQSDDSAEEASRGVLSIPGGGILLGAVGLGILVAGVSYAVIGVRRDFRKKMTLPAGVLGTTVTALGVIGYVAKGLALGVVGILVGIAAVTVDAETAGGLDAAIQSLLDLPAGPAIVMGVGAGFAAYGVFCFFRVRYADL